MKYIYLFFYVQFTSDERHAWLHLYAASPGARNTEQEIIAKEIIVHSKIRTLTWHGFQISSPPP